MKIIAASAIVPIILIVVPIDQVNAHGYISKPKATYQSNPNIEYYTGYNAEIDASVNSGFSGGTYNGSPVDNTASFTEHWAATGYSSLKEMCDPYATDYGWSVSTATPIDVSSYTEFWWQNDQYQEGFLDSHHGPCELWIDDTRVWHYDDCRAEFPDYPASIPTDYSVCNGDCLVVFYWLALHSSQWQIYKQCVPITNPNGTGASTSSTSSNSTSSTTASTSTTTTASSQTEAEADDDLDDSEDGCSQRRMDRKMRRRMMRALKAGN